jgi:hypothetical protein
LSVLSGLSVDDLSAAIAAQEIGRIVKVPGIGKKTAERLLLELKGRPVGAGAVAGTESGVSDDAPGFAGLGQREGSWGCDAKTGRRHAVSDAICKPEAAVQG